MEYVEFFHDLEVYQVTRKMSKDIFDISKEFPKEEMYSLTDQVRRSSRSIGAQIAEAWGKRRYPNHFMSKLTDANSELLETQHWIDTALNCQYITSKVANDINTQCISIDKMLNSMMAKADSFAVIKKPDSKK